MKCNAFGPRRLEAEDGKQVPAVEHGWEESVAERIEPRDELESLGEGATA
jgi:hypothetical protein